MNLLPWKEGATIWCSEKGEKPAQWVLMLNTPHWASLCNRQTLKTRDIVSDTPMQIKRKEIVFL